MYLSTSIVLNPNPDVDISLLFNSYISHGYMLRDFMKTASVPITKNKTGDSSEKTQLQTYCISNCLLKDI